MEILSTLLSQYQDDTYMLAKLNAHMAHLPGVMANVQAARQRKESVASQIEALAPRLVHGFYYLHVRFIQVEETYHFISKDDVLHELYHRMSGLELPASKHQICQSVMPIIKRQFFYDQCHPSRAVQKAVVRALYPGVFTKEVAKYFVTIVGDMLLNKRDLVYFMCKSFKPFLTEVEAQVQRVGRVLLDCFKHKYHEHPYTKSRIIPGTWNGGAFTATLDFMAVAVFYSRKYGGADKFAAKMTLAPQVFMLKDHTPVMLVQKFLKEYTQPAEGTVPFKHMYYMWRHFLRRAALPCVIARHNLKHIMRGLGLLEDDTCVNVEIVGKANVLNFEQFWNGCIQPCPNNEFTIAEVVGVYNHWCDTRTLHITEEEGLAWLDKHHSRETLKHIRCTLWDKASAIENAMELFKYDPEYSADPAAMYAFYKAYTERSTKFIATFEYFEKYVTLFSSH